MELIIPASQVQVGDSIRFSLKNYFFNSNQEWRDQCEQTVHVTRISPCQFNDGKLEFEFKESLGGYRGIDPNTEVVLVYRPVEYVYSYGINPTDPRDSYGGGFGTIVADSDEQAVQKIHEKHGQPPIITVDWVYAVDHKVSLKLSEVKK